VIFKSDNIRLGYFPHLAPNASPGRPGFGVLSFVPSDSDSRMEEALLEMGLKHG